MRRNNVKIFAKLQVTFYMKRRRKTERQLSAAAKGPDQSDFFHEKAPLNESFSAL